jgi:hypothetical protein
MHVDGVYKRVLERGRKTELQKGQSRAQRGEERRGEGESERERERERERIGLDQIESCREHRILSM